MLITTLTPTKQSQVIARFLSNKRVSLVQPTDAQPGAFSSAWVIRASSDFCELSLDMLTFFTLRLLSVGRTSCTKDANEHHLSNRVVERNNSHELIDKKMTRQYIERSIKSVGSSNASAALVTDLPPLFPRYHAQSHHNPTTTLLHGSFEDHSRRRRRGRGRN